VDNPPNLIYASIARTNTPDAVSIIASASCTPQYIFANLGIDFANAQPISYFYAARNVGILILCLFGLLMRDSKVLLSMLVLRFTVELLDLVATLKFGIGGMNPVITAVTWLIVFLIPEFWAAFTLYKKDFTE